MDDIKHVWSIICDKAIVDKATNSLSLLGSVDEIRLESDNKEKAQGELEKLKEENKKLAVPVNITLVSLWYHNITEDASVLEVVELLNLDGNSIWRKEQDIALDAKKQRTRAIMQFKGFELPPEAGTYILSISRKEGESVTNVAEIPLDFKINMRG